MAGSSVPRSSQKGKRDDENQQSISEALRAASKAYAVTLTKKAQQPRFMNYSISASHFMHGGRSYRAVKIQGRRGIRDHLQGLNGHSLTEIGDQVD